MTLNGLGLHFAFSLEYSVADAARCSESMVSWQTQWKLRSRPGPYGKSYGDGWEGYGGVIQREKAEV